MYLLLLLSSLLHIATCTVYTVTPDDHYYPNTTCHHCHNLQHYLLNVTKYFTSNTQLLFLPGIHQLHTDLIIQNFHNISLIGSTANGTTSITVIQHDTFTVFKIKDCSFVLLIHLHIYSTLPGSYFYLFGINIMSNSNFSNISIISNYSKILLFYNETYTASEHHTLKLNNCTATRIEIEMLQNSYTVTLKITNM